MRSTALIATAAAALLATGANASVVINEMHYDNVSGDVGEFIEVVLTGGEAAANVDIILYNGNGGASYNSFNLAIDFAFDGTLGDGNDYYSIMLPANGLQNGSPDGLASTLLGAVQEFLSYEGAFTATNGAANGLTSTDIGKAEGGGTPIGSSLQRLAFGNGWRLTNGSNTKGAINVVPAPGALALLGLAGLAARRRRRRG